MNTLIRAGGFDNLQPVGLQHADMWAAVRKGLRSKPKRLPSKYFYDDCGSQLFERICEQPEYYLTRVELAIMQEWGADMAAALGPDIRLVEYGNGNSLKTQALLTQLHIPLAYVPIEISQAALMRSVTRLSSQFPQIEILPICADFTHYLPLPQPRSRPHRTVVYFPGSTIGNFDTQEAITLLHHVHKQIGPSGGVLIGVDLKKERSILEAAYNDAAGVTVEFTLNMLSRFNRELGADFNLSAFRHRAQYNALAGRIETYLVSNLEQDIHINHETFHFKAEEAMLVEYSSKYSLGDFARLALKAGLRVERVWMDADRLFSVQYLVR